LSDPNFFDHSLDPVRRPEFKYSRNQASKSPVSSKENPSSEKNFQTFIPIHSSFPLPLVVTIEKNSLLQHSSFQLLHAIRSGTIIKHPPFLKFVNMVLFSSQIFYCLRKLNLFLDLRQNFTSCRLSMSIDVALFIRARHVNVRWIPEEDVYAFGIQSSGVFILNFWLTIQKSQFIPIYPTQNSNNICQL
jgi:hypothetical protein